MYGLGWNNHLELIRFRFSFLNCCTDPNDWALNRFYQEKKGIKYDYSEIDNKQIALTLVWSAGILSLGGRALYSYQTGAYFWSFIFNN
jgi:hypothetical protein